jgi:hypothetical protein
MAQQLWLEVPLAYLPQKTAGGFINFAKNLAQFLLVEIPLEVNRMQKLRYR